MLFGECGSMNVSKINFFFNLFLHKQILEEYSLTHGIEYIMVWRNILLHVHG
jgi:hypothetical protein